MIAKSDSIMHLATALSKAQAEIKGASKDVVNTFFKSRYADLSAVWDACREALTKNGLSIVQPTAADGPRVTVNTMLMHESGEWISEALTVTAKDESAQSLGSAITYARRYALAAMVGVAPEDDDGEAAVGRTIDAKHREESKDKLSPNQKRTQELVNMVTACKDEGELDAAAEVSKKAFADKEITKSNLEYVASVGRQKRESLKAMEQQNDFFDKELSKELQQTG